ncbi:MAG: cation:proton antiporter [Anaerolineales bacterium]
MTPFLQLIFLLAFTLLAAKIFGYLSIRLGQPSVLGELIVGVILGPSFLNLMNLPFIDQASMGEILHLMGEIGVLLLMFIAGMELEFNELLHTGRVALLSGTLGVVVPVLFGFGLGLLLHMEARAAFFLGLTLGATSVSISAQTLLEMNVLRTRVGFGLLGAAVFDDILVILFLSIFFAFGDGSGNLGSILLVFGRMTLFFAFAALFGLWVLPRLIRRVRNSPVSQPILSLAVVVMLGYGLAAELMGGMAAITGAFLSGLMFARSPEKEVLTPRISALAYGFFVPIFFVNIGLDVHLETLFSGLLLTVLLIMAAVFGKFIGAGLGAYWGGFSWREAAQLGAGMISRGEVGLIVASVGAAGGLINDSEFSAIVEMVVITTLITPLALRWLFKLPVNQQTTKGVEKAVL